MISRRVANDQHVYAVRPRRDKRGVDLIADALPFGGLRYAGPNAVANAIGYAQHRSRSHDAVIRVYEESIKGSGEIFRYLGSELSIEHILSALTLSGPSLFGLPLLERGR